MYRELIYPNLHVALVHFPMALLILGTMIEAFSFLGWKRSTFLTAGRWMILLGALLSVPASLSGLYALKHDGWESLPATSKQLMWRHGWIQGGATAASLFVAITWLGSSDTWRARLRGPWTLLLLIVSAAIGLGAWHAGEGVYRHRIGVASDVAGPTSLPTSLPTAADVDTMLPPLDVHVTLAGFTAAIALAALALTMRAASEPAAPVKDMDDLTFALSSEDGERTARRTHVPAARFWLLTLLLAVGTAALGARFLARDGDIALSDYRTLWNVVKDPIQNDGHALTRRLAHVAGGAGIVIAPLLLAFVARFAPRSRFVLGILSLLLLAAIASQVWIGTLMLYDTTSGPVTRFSTTHTS